MRIDANLTDFTTPRPGDEPGRAVRVKPKGPRPAPNEVVPNVDAEARRLALAVRHYGASLTAA